MCVFAGGTGIPLSVDSNLFNVQPLQALEMQHCTAQGLKKEHSSLSAQTAAPFPSEANQNTNITAFGLKHDQPYLFSVILYKKWFYQLKLYLKIT